MFCFSISPSNEYSGLISFRMDWLDVLAVQGALKSLLQHHTPKASILWCSAFFIVQLSHPYMTTGKIKALTRWIFCPVVMSVFYQLEIHFSESDLYINNHVFDLCVYRGTLTRCSFLFELLMIKNG